MGQLDVYSLEDISVLTIIAGPLSTYFSEEIEVSIESVVAYVYSSNILSSKKRCKFVKSAKPAGDIAGAIHKTWSYLQLTKHPFSAIRRPIEDRVMWQDPYLSQWEGASERKNLERLQDKYSW